MVLHLFHQNNFVKETIYVLKYSNLNHKIIVLNKEEINKINGINYYNKNEAIDFINSNKSIRIIIIHYLSALKIEIIQKSNYKGKIHWSAWGGDLYTPHFNFTVKQLLEQKTINFLKQNKLYKEINIMNRVDDWIRPILLLTYKIVKQKKHPYAVIKEFLPKINSCSTVLPYEFDIVKSKIKNIAYYPFVYGELDYFIPKKIEKLKTIQLGGKILVGNSGTPSNNHFKILTELNKFDLLVPLTYGNLQYIKKIKQSFNKKNINFIEKHLPLNNYIELLTSCNTFIINSYRQQGIGNILFALYLGMRVYLNKNNPALNFYKSIGVSIFCYQTDFKNFENLPLTKKEVEKNKQSIKKYWGKQNVIKMIREFDNQIKNL